MIQQAQWNPSQLRFLADLQLLPIIQPHPVAFVLVPFGALALAVILTGMNRRRLTGAGAIFAFVILLISGPALSFVVWEYTLKYTDADTCDGMGQLGSRYVQPLFVPKEVKKYLYPSVDFDQLQCEAYEEKMFKDARPGYLAALALLLGLLAITYGMAGTLLFRFYLQFENLVLAFISAFARTKAG